MTGHALIIGAGVGLSASVARVFKRDGYAIGLAGRDPAKHGDLAKQTDAKSFACDVADEAQVNQMFKDFTAQVGTPDVVVFNPSYRTRGPLVELDAGEVHKTLEISAYGGFLVGQAAARIMLQNKSGAILFTGASASVKGYAQSAPFAMGKFALRGLAQSMARELHPQNIHVAHFVIDGGIRIPGRPDRPGGPDNMLEPDAIAETYLSIVKQHRSAWTWEVELRPWVENF
jgi:NAD(P)-dependent dehydrogenase (short-subunit alcohol dehydrogenase family)